MSFGDDLRAAWRRIKDPVLAGKGNLAQRVAYRLLAGFVTRNKSRFRSTDLQSLALWLMYHPESGILPCDGWKMNPPPRLADEELATLAERVLTDDDIRYCPHGRPVCIEIPRREWEKQFGRIV